MISSQKHYWNGREAGLSFRPSSDSNRRTTKEDRHVKDQQQDRRICNHDSVAWLRRNGVGSALAHEGRTQVAPREAVDRHVAHRFAGPGYAGPVSSSVAGAMWTIRPNLQFVPGRGIPGQSGRRSTRATPEFLFAASIYGKSWLRCWRVYPD
jgi:hypothetical protein